MSNTSSLTEFFLRVIKDLESEAAAKGQKFPIDKLRFETDELGGQLFAPSYVQYIFLGRGPGKFPPPDRMTAWVEANPDVLARAKQVFKYLTSKSLGYLIGRKIAREGTDVFSGKKQAMDFIGLLEKNTPTLFQQLARNEAVKVATSLKTAIDGK